MDIFLEYDGRFNESYLDNIPEVKWERTHRSPFSDLYDLHAHLEHEERQGLIEFPSSIYSYNSNYSYHNKSTCYTAREHVRFYVEVIGIMLVGIPGLTGNILSIIVLLSAKMRSPITYLLLGLAFTDILMIANGILGISIKNLCIYLRIDLLEYRFVATLPTIIAIGRTAHLASTLYCLVITLERYLAVKDPIKSLQVCTLQRAKFTSIVILIFSILYGIPKWFEYTWITIPAHFDKIDGFNKEEYYYLPLTTSLKRNHLYRISMTIIHFIFFYTLPMFLIIYLNVLIYVKLKSAAKERESMTVSQQRENNVTTMLFVIVFVYILCNILPLVNLIKKIVTSNYEIPYLDPIRNFLWVFNSSINFFIYYAYSDGFRQTCRQTWPLILFIDRKRRNKATLRYTASTATFTSSISSCKLNFATVRSPIANESNTSNYQKNSSAKVTNGQIQTPVSNNHSIIKFSV